MTTDRPSRILTVLREQHVDTDPPAIRQQDPVYRWMLANLEEWEDLCDAGVHFLCTRYDGHMMDGLEHVASGDTLGALKVW